MKPLTPIILLALAVCTAEVHGISSERNESRIIVLVTDGASKGVIENAQIQVEPGRYAEQTNAEGITEIGNLSAGVYILYASASGYDRMQALNVKVSNASPTGISLALRGETVEAVITIEQILSHTSSISNGPSLLRNYRRDATTFSPEERAGGIFSARRTILAPRKLLRAQGTRYGIPVFECRLRPACSMRKMSRLLNLLFTYAHSYGSIRSLTLTNTTSKSIA